MKPVQIPNLPDDDVKAVIIDNRAPDTMKKTIARLGIKTIPTSAHSDVYDAVAYHPDIMLHHINENVIVYAPGTSAQLIANLSSIGFEMVKGQTGLGLKYPHTIAYNVARVGKFAFHNTKYTDPVIKKYLNQNGIEIIHVKQGYSKCLTCVVNENSIITSDTDICRKAEAAGLDVLLIEPDNSISLAPFDMGFIGGASGLIGRNKLAFAGNLEFHRNYKEIMDFLSLKAVDVVMLNGENLMDLGTIIPILQA